MPRLLPAAGDTLRETILLLESEVSSMEQRMNSAKTEAQALKKKLDDVRPVGRGGVGEGAALVLTGCPQQGEAQAHADALPRAAQMQNESAITQLRDRPGRAKCCSVGRLSAVRYARLPRASSARLMIPPALPPAGQRAHPHLLLRPQAAQP